MAASRDKRQIKSGAAMSWGTLKIRTLKFDVQVAKLQPFFSGRFDPTVERKLAWGVVVQARRPGRYADWEPCFTADQLLETVPNEVESWRQLVGRRGTWRDEDGTEERGSLLTFEHEPVVNAEWGFELSPAKRLVFVLKGFSRFAHSELYKGLLPISIRAELAFAPIPMRGSKEPTCRKELARFGIADRFQFAVNHGTSYLVPQGYRQPAGVLSKRARTEF